MPLIEIALMAIGGMALVVLLRRAFFCGIPTASEEVPWFNRIDTIVILAFSILLGSLGVQAIQGPAPVYTLDILRAGILVQVIVGSGVLTYLVVRKVPLGRFFWHGKISLLQAIGLAILLMALLWPAVGLANFLVNGVDATGENSQDLVKFFETNPDPAVRWWMAFAAVIVAPVVEELVFRGLIYGVLKRQFGRVVPMLFTSVLFALVHGHLPSFVPLTVLACCLTIGLELSGTLFVPMLMHAIFNATTLLFIVFKVQTFL
ncbi:MAG TPA: type II CAAX endopeptidase family protein [Chthoniobacterales bacterium]